FRSGYLRRQAVFEAPASLTRLLNRAPACPVQVVPLFFRHGQSSPHPLPLRHLTDRQLQASPPPHPRTEDELLEQAQGRHSEPEAGGRRLFGAHDPHSITPGSTEKIQVFVAGNTADNLSYAKCKIV